MVSSSQLPSRLGLNVVCKNKSLDYLSSSPKQATVFGFSTKLTEKIPKSLLVIALAYKYIF